ncbi:formate dehydrogenase accessory sulfurtransferase FdhD [Nocardia aurea]|uniref:formate dehydrogenase accessory sulfurtransferase FdhD n=1 Tax=Nocardia aurea TaxID=2144174 RepID=UPI000D6915E7|nr:formate dehydrogenase accessory sulfurtransferase FdhD [Nocardia aurea]
MGRVTTRVRINRYRDGFDCVAPDTVVVEEPLEIRINNKPVAITMRTPGADIELAQGFLLAEGIIADRDDIAAIRYCDSRDAEGRNTYNVLTVELAAHIAPPQLALERNFYTSSSCGICGKASLDAIRQRTKYSPATDIATVSSHTVSTLPDALAAAQKVFATTGGLHAAGLFTTGGELLALREDVGRHNATDKLIGWSLEQNRIPLRGTIMLVSGRVSFELAQKAVMAGIPILAAVSAPTSLAIDLAEDTGLTLIGFLRGRAMNVYTHFSRIRLCE